MFIFIFFCLEFKLDDIVLEIKDGVILVLVGKFRGTYVVIIFVGRGGR